MTISARLGLLRSLVIYFNPLLARRTRRFYSQFLAPGDLVFDVGAHVGSRARALRAVGAKVVAFEPQPMFASFLRRSLPSDIVLVEAALGPSEAMAEMVVSSRHPTVSSLRTSLSDEARAMPGFEHVRWDERAQVKMTSLDAMIAAHGEPRYIKIDVEGFEPDVLAGLSRPIELVSLEYLPGLPQVSAKVIAMLCALGAYEFNIVRGESARFEWAQWQEADALRAFLASLERDENSGDFYARRKQR